MILYIPRLTYFQCLRTAWQYASSFSSSLSTPSTESHIIALHQALIPNWTSPAFSKFIDACRALVDELANITTARDGKEEMMRCEEIFRQICWLEERFWPNVDGMGEENDSGRLGPNLGPMGAGMENAMNNGMSSGMNGPMQMNGPQMNEPQMNSLNNGLPNGPMQMNGQMNGQMNSQMGPQMSSQMNAQMNSQMNTGERSAGGDGRNSFALPNENS